MDKIKLLEQSFFMLPMLFVAVITGLFIFDKVSLDTMLLGFLLLGLNYSLVATIGQQHKVVVPTKPNPIQEARPIYYGHEKVYEAPLPPPDDELPDMEWPGPQQTDHQNENVPAWKKEIDAYNAAPIPKSKVLKREPSVIKRQQKAKNEYDRKVQEEAQIRQFEAEARRKGKPISISELPAGMELR